MLDKKLTSKGDRGIVTVETKGINQHGDEVCYFRRKVMVWTTDAAPAARPALRRVDLGRRGLASRCATRASRSRPTPSARPPATTSGPGRRTRPRRSTLLRRELGIGAGRPGLRPRRRHRQADPPARRHRRRRRRRRAGARHARAARGGAAPTSRCSTAPPRRSRCPTARSTPSPSPRRSTGSTSTRPWPRSRRVLRPGGGLAILFNEPRRDGRRGSQRWNDGDRVARAA